MSGPPFSHSSSSDNVWAPTFATPFPIENIPPHSRPKRQEFVHLDMGCVKLINYVEMDIAYSS
jgi:hypothetical protein